MTPTGTPPSDLLAYAPHSPTDYQEREQIWFIINRAYQNIYGLNLPADAAYQKIIFDAALQLRRDERSDTLGDKIFLQACEDIIRISDEHQRLAQKHFSRASNPIYLCETAIDNARQKLEAMRAGNKSTPLSEVATGGAPDGPCTLLDGRLKPMGHPPSSAEIMELAWQQLALNTQKR